MFTSLHDPALIDCLNAGGIVVVPTETMYGVLARAAHQEAVERVYRVRGRAPEKPCIMLVAGRDQITDTGSWTAAHHKLAQTYWPGPLSLVAPTTTVPEYLHRGTHTMAYRVPAHDGLRQLLRQTGPLIAPSANPEGSTPATTIPEAQAYFGDNVDGYVDGGTLTPDVVSTVVGVQDGKIHIFRQGAAKIDLHG